MKSREKQILELISRGYTTQEISERLYLSSETVKTYRSRLLSKLNAKNVANLVYVAVRGGYLGIMTLLLLGPANQGFSQSTYLEINLTSLKYCNDLSFSVTDHDFAIPSCVPIGDCGNPLNYQDPEINVMVKVFNGTGEEIATLTSFNRYGGAAFSLAPEDPINFNYTFDDPDFRVEVYIDGREIDDGIICNDDDDVCGGFSIAGVIEPEDLLSCQETFKSFYRRCGSGTYFSRFTFVTYPDEDFEPGKIDAPITRLEDRNDLISHINEVTFETTPSTTGSIYEWFYFNNDQWISTGETKKHLKVYEFILNLNGAFDEYLFKRRTYNSTSSCTDVALFSNILYISVGSYCKPVVLYEDFEDQTLDPPFFQYGDLDGVWSYQENGATNSSYCFKTGYSGTPATDIYSAIEVTINVPDTFHYLSFHEKHRMQGRVELRINGQTIELFDSTSTSYMYKEYSLPVGENIIVWRYQKLTTDALQRFGEYFLLDNINVTKKHPDFQPLLDIFYATRGDFFWNNNEGWKDRVVNPNCDVCSWYGVQCDPITSRVTKLNLEGNGLSGNINFTIGEMHEIQEINLGNNADLIGSVPNSLYDLSNLRELHLDSTGLNTEISWKIGNLSELKVLDLSDANFMGLLPVEIYKLNNLEELHLNNNQFSGHFLPFIEHNTKLRIVQAQHNNFAGDLPKAIGELKDIEHIQLNNNKFKSRLKPEWSDLINPELHTLRLDSNDLYGCIPATFQHFCQIHNFNLSHNPDLPNGGNIDSICTSMVGLCCEQNIAIDALNISSGVYRAIDNISIKGTIAPEANTVFSAKNAIGILELENSLNGILEVNNDGCDEYWPYEGQVFTPTGSLAPGNEYGEALDMDGEWLAIGDPGVNKVYLYKYDSTGQWLEHQTINGPDGSKFGENLYLNNNKLIVGAPHYSTQGINPATRCGAVRIYRYTETIDSSWEYLTQVIPETPLNNLNFGKAVAVKSNVALVGDNSSSVHSYTQHSIFPTNWQYQQSIQAEDNDGFGSHIEYRTLNPYIGAPYATINSNIQQGAIYEVTAHGMEKIELPNGNSYDRFGLDFHQVGSKLLVSVPGFDVNGVSNVGAAFEISSGSVLPYYPQDTTLSDQNYGSHSVITDEGIAITHESKTKIYSAPAVTNEVYYPHVGVKTSNGSWIAVGDTDHSRVWVYPLKN